MINAWNELIGRLTGAGSLETKKGASMKLIVGLGNPGSNYHDTRHNVGFMAVDALAERFGAAIRRKKFNSLTEEIRVGDTAVLLLKPQQYMNRSGHAVATAAGFYKLSGADILVVTDDMALDVGRIRLRAKGSAGGHNGLKDIIARLGHEDFARLRIGIGDSGPMDAADYVLSRFRGDERDVIDRTIHTAVEAVVCWLCDGVDLAMTRYNVKDSLTD